MFTHLKVKSNYSLLQALSSVEELVQTAKELGFSAFALTDRNAVYAYPELMKAAKKFDIKAIYGIELDYQVDEETYSLLLYAKNYQGFKEINKLSSYVMTNHQVTHSILKQVAKNLICVAPGYESGFIEDQLLKGREDKAKQELDTLRTIFDDFYLSYSYHGFEIEKRINGMVLQFAKVNNVKTVLFNDVLFASASDSQYFPYLEAIHSSTTINESDLYEHKYFKSAAEMTKLLRDDMAENIENIVKSCNVEFKKEDIHIPIYKSYSNYDTNSYLRALCERGLKKRYNNLTDIHIKRLNYELDMIIKMNFSDYFLIVFDFVRYAKKQGIYVGPGRGSACSSIVSYCLGITNIDPIKYDLIFERFLNPERISMPDIDIDFQDDRRDEVIKYVQKKYGHDKVAQIVAFATYGAKMAIRDVCKVMEIPSGEVDKISRLIPKGTNVSLEATYQNVASFREFINSSQKYSKMFEVSKRLEKNPKHTTIHAAGLVISNQKISDIIGVQSSSEDGFLATQLSMNYLEQFGLIKMDFLGLRNLTLLKNIVDAIEVNIQSKFDLDSIDLEDELTLKLFQKGDTNGIFQFESEGMKNVLRKLKPSAFKDVYAANALFRPGPMDNIDEFTKRKHNLFKKYVIDDSLISILEDTYGIIVYQEQILEIARKLADFSYAEADILRKAMSKKDTEMLLKQKDKFVTGCLNKGHTKELALEVYDLIFKFSNYGFVKSHSVAYSVVGFQLAYLKTHYTKYFMAAMLQQSRHSKYGFSLYKREAKRYGIELLKPNVLKSDYNFVVENESIRCSLNLVTGIKQSVIECCINARQVARNFIDYVCEFAKCGIDKEIVIRLIKSGAFDCFDYNKKTMIMNLDDIYQYAELINFSVADQVAFKFGSINKPIIKKHDEYPSDVILEFELEVFGFYFEAHPVDKYKMNIECNNSLEVESLLHKNISLILLITKTKEIKTKNNKLMAFFEGSDEVGDVNLTLFPDVYTTVKGNLQGKVVHVFGRVDKRNNAFNVLIDKIGIL